MVKRDSVRDFLEQVKVWGRNTEDISAIILVGSYARGEAQPDSDIDLVIVAIKPQRYLIDQTWLDYFGEPLKTQHEDWGLVQSLRVWFESGLEIEFGFTSEEWIAEPLDKGTRKVLDDGNHFIVNKKNYLAGK